MSIDTIRYYMDMELIVPGRQGNLYDFTEDSIEDIRWIYKLKDMGFSLKEIQKILALRRTSNWVEPQEIAEYLILLGEKKKGLQEKIGEIKREILRIEEEEQSFAKKAAGNQTLIGVPLKALEYFRCPCCGEVFAVEEVQMNSRYVYKGRLSCNCGYSLEIKNGIVKTPNLSGAGEGDIAREKYKNLPASVITMLQRSYNFILHRLWDFPLENKVILETDINEFFYLYTHFRRLNTRPLFIVTDRYPKVLEMYKERIEYMKLDLDIVYLAAEGHYPLKPRCADIVLDYFTSNYREKRKAQSFSELAKEYLAPGGELLGCYYCGENTEGKKFLKDLEKTGYCIERERQIPCPKEIGSKRQLLLYDAVKKE